MYAFGIGLVLPVIPWAMNKVWPHPYWYLINMPILTFASSPGAPNPSILPVAIIGFIFQFYLRRYSKELFDKYNYVIAVALDSGLAIATLMFTVVLSLAGEGVVSIGPLNPETEPDFYCYGGSYKNGK